MAQRKSGPVKPPVIDLTARETASAPAPQPDSVPAQESEPEAPDALPPEMERTVEPEPVVEESIFATSPPEPRSEPPPATPPQKPASLAQLPSPDRSGTRTLLLGIGGGAILGTALTYLLAAGGLLPPGSNSAAVPDGRELAARTAALEDSVAAAAAGATEADARIAELTQALDAASAEVATLKSAPPVDLAALETEVQSLTERLATVSAGVPAADPEVAQSLDGLRTDLAALSTSITGISGRIDALETSTTTLTADLGAAKAELARPRLEPEVVSALQLPLLLSSLQTAFTTGAPYSGDLLNLVALDPTLAVPKSIADRAATGLSSHEDIAQRLSEAMPDILAARPVDSNAGWENTTLDWLKTLLAARPTGEIAGDTPEAIVSRIEGAVSRGDFADATTLFEALPEPMRVAAGDLPGEVAAQAEAAGFIEALRTSALGDEAKS